MAAAIMSDHLPEYDFAEKYDCVIACLNPSTYQPDALDIMLSVSSGPVIYFSMDTPTDQSDMEPVYHGCYHIPMI